MRFTVFFILFLMKIKQNIIKTLKKLILKTSFKLNLINTLKSLSIIPNIIKAYYFQINGCILFIIN